MVSIVHRFPFGNTLFIELKRKKKKLQVEDSPKSFIHYCCCGNKYGINKMTEKLKAALCL